MRLALTSLVQVSSKQLINPNPLPQTYGLPPIECDLDDAEAQHVWNHGIPDSLVKSMRDTATKNKWKPIPPSGFQGTPPATIRIATAGCFPEGSTSDDPADGNEDQ